MTEAVRDYLPIDPKYFKAFMAAATTLNFTAAAARSCMTQSGISQHIARLEDQIGLPLFKRTGKKVTLTDTGKKLVMYIQDQTYSAETFLDAIRLDHRTLSGLVSYAMPPSCIYSPHFPLLLEKRKKHPRISLDVRLAPNVEIVQLIRDYTIDFGFITSTIDTQQLRKQFFCQEEYVMIGSNSDEIAKITGDTIFHQRYIMYPGAEDYYDIWLKHHYPEYNSTQSPLFPVSGRINSIAGAIEMVCGGLGMAVFPRHCIETRLRNGTLSEYHSIFRPPLLNDIHIIRVDDHHHPKRVEQVIDWFVEMKKENTDIETVCA